MSKRRKKTGPPFVMLEKEMLRSKEWKELSMAEKLIYIKLKANFNGSNNGQISFKYTETKGEFSSATVCKVLKSLVTKGWITKTQYGGMHRFYCLYKLTGKYDKLREW